MKLAQFNRRFTAQAIPNVDVLQVQKQLFEFQNRKNFLEAFLKTVQIKSFIKVWSYFRIGSIVGPKNPDRGSKSTRPLISMILFLTGNEVRVSQGYYP